MKPKTNNTMMVVAPIQPTRYMVCAAREAYQTWSGLPLPKDDPYTIIFMAMMRAYSAHPMIDRISGQELFNRQNKLNADGSARKNKHA